MTTTNVRLETLAVWLFQNNGSLSALRWDRVAIATRNRWRAMARRMLEEFEIRRKKEGQ